MHRIGHVGGGEVQLQGQPAEVRVAILHHSLLVQQLPHNCAVVPAPQGPHQIALTALPGHKLAYASQGQLAVIQGDEIAIVKHTFVAQLAPLRVYETAAYAHPRPSAVCRLARLQPFISRGGFPSPFNPSAAAQRTIQAAGEGYREAYHVGPFTLQMPPQQGAHQLVHRCRLCVQRLVQLVEGRGICRQLLGIIHQAEMPVHSLAQGLRHLLQEERSHIASPIRDARRAESPFHVLLASLSATSGQQTAVHNAPSQRIVLPAQEAHHRLHHLGGLQQLSRCASAAVIRSPPCRALEPVSTHHPVHQLYAQVRLCHVVAAPLQIALQHRRGGIRRVQLRERRDNQQELHFAKSQSIINHQP